jgi:hypothetical protein
MLQTVGIRVESLIVRTMAGRCAGNNKGPVRVGWLLLLVWLVVDMKEET